MALDEPRDSDNKFKVDGFDYVVDSELMKKAEPIKIDFQGMGFKLDCGIDFGTGGGCSGCSSDSKCS